MLFLSPSGLRVVVVKDPLTPDPPLTHTPPPPRAQLYADEGGGGGLGSREVWCQGVLHDNDTYTTRPKNLSAELKINHMVDSFKHGELLINGQRQSKHQLCVCKLLITTKHCRLLRRCTHNAVSVYKLIAAALLLRGCCCVPDPPDQVSTCPTCLPA